MKVILAFRDSRKKGKSIEGVFQELLDALTGIEIIKWEYNSQISLFQNIHHLRSLQGDMIHITGGITYISNFLFNKKVIITFHDIGRYKELQGIKKSIYKRLWIRWPIRNAIQITTVSEYTRNDIVNLIPSAAQKIRVIPNGIPSGFVANETTFNKSNPRILQVGTTPNKNIETVFTALQGLNCALSIIGPLSSIQTKALDRLNINYEMHLDLDSAALKREYDRCDIVVFVSLHEGFGMPIIEAQATGRVVITSRLASLPEVAGKGAHFVIDPLDSRELASAIKKVVDEDAYRATLIKDGFENVKRFSLDKMRKSYLELYQDVMRK